MCLAEELSGQTAELFARLQSTSAHFAAETVQVVHALVVRTHDQFVRLNRLPTRVALPAEDPVQSRTTNQSIIMATNWLQPCSTTDYSISFERLICLINGLRFGLVATTERIPHANIGRVCLAL